MTKQNKLTPGSNLLWESSRMMLPEHKQVLRRHQKKLTEKRKPIFDEQQLDLLSHTLSLAIEQKANVNIQLFHPYHAQSVEGKIKSVRPEQHKLQLWTENGAIWVHFHDILQITLLSEHR